MAREVFIDNADTFLIVALKLKLRKQNVKVSKRRGGKVSCLLH